MASNATSRKFDPVVTDRAFRSDAYRREIGWGPRELQLALDEADAFDETYGTDTASIDFVTPPGMYVPVLPVAFRHVVSTLDLRLEDWVFLDIGSGKGRGILLASEHPFKRCLGVELSPIHHATAVKNIEVFRSPRRRSPSVESILADATAYDYPKDDLFVWLFNPFARPVMEAFLASFEAALEAHPRRVVLVYMQQEHETAFERLRFLKKWGPQGGPCTMPIIVTDGVFPYSIYSNM